MMFRILGPSNSLHTSPPSMAYAEETGYLQRKTTDSRTDASVKNKYLDLLYLAEMGVG